MPRVSIVMATHNRSGWLSAAIESVRTQTFGNWELIVVDDGSTDETAAVLARYRRLDPRIRVVGQPASGLSLARRRGIAEAAGEYLAFLDDDDSYLPWKLEQQVAALERAPEAAFVYSYVDVVDDTGRILRSLPQERPAETFEGLLRACTIQDNSILVRRASLVDLGDLWEWLHGHDDYALWLFMARRHPFRFLPEHVARYRWHDANMSRRLEERYHDHLTIYGTLLADRLGSAERRAARQASAVNAYRLAQLYRERSEYRRAGRYFAHAVRHDPWVGGKVRRGPMSPVTWLLQWMKPYLACGYCFARRGGRDGAGVEHRREKAGRRTRVRQWRSGCRVRMRGRGR